MKLLDRDLAEEVERKMKLRDKEEKVRAKTLTLRGQNEFMKKIQKLRDKKVMESLANSVAHMTVVAPADKPLK